MRRGCLLLAIEAIDDAPRLHAAGVGVDVDLWGVGTQADRVLLRGKHRHVFEERCLDLVEHPFGHFRIVRLEIMRLRPEIVRGGFGLGRNRVEIAHADAADPAAFRRAGAGRAGADIEAQEGRRGIVDDLPAVDIGW